MRGISRHPVFAGIAFFCLLTFTIETWFVLERWRAARRGADRVAHADAALRMLKHATPPATADTTKTMETELAAVSEQLELLQNRLLLDDAFRKVQGLKAAPVEPADAYFDIASFVERMRDQARERGVETKLDERFGFAEYAHAGPTTTELSGVFRERLAVEFLLGALFAAKPRRLISVQRERRVASASGPLERSQGNAASGRADPFEWDLRGSVRRAATIDARGLRVSFVSQTVSLRLLLNTLADSPLVVRTVEVVAAPPPGPVRNPERAEDRAEPLVPESYSQITVTVELIEMAAAAAGS